MSTNLPSVYIPQTPAELEKVEKSCKNLVHMSAGLASFGNLIPLPGVDLLIDMGTLMKLIDSINHKFGLTPQQIEVLDDKFKILLGNLIIQTGAEYAGKFITKTLLQEAAKKIIAKVAGKTVLKYIPFVGQTVAIGISFATIEIIANGHIKKCREIVRLANESQVQEAEIVSSKNESKLLN